MKLSWQHDNEWHDFSTDDLIWHQETWKVAAMFEGMPLPVVANIGHGRYLCTANVFADVKKKHKNTRTFRSIPHDERPFGRFIESII